MSAGGNAEVLRSALEAYNRGGVDAILDYIHPEFEGVVTPDVSLEPDTYAGHDGIRRYFASFYDTMSSVRFDVEYTEEHDGDAVIMEGRLITIGRGSGIETELQATLTWWVNDGKLFRARAATDLEAARAELKEPPA